MSWRSCLPNLIPRPCGPSRSGRTTCLCGLLIALSFILRETLQLRWQVQYYDTGGIGAVSTIFRFENDHGLLATRESLIILGLKMGAYMDPSRLQERSSTAAVEWRRVHISGLVMRSG